jgi:hypothetical protein
LRPFIIMPHVVEKGATVWKSLKKIIKTQAGTPTSFQIQAKRAYVRFFFNHSSSSYIIALISHLPLSSE